MWARSREVARLYWCVRGVLTISKRVMGSAIELARSQRSAQSECAPKLLASEQRKNEPQWGSNDPQERIGESMRISTRSIGSWMLQVAIVVTCWLFGSSAPLQAQDNTVWTLSGGQNAFASSSAFIDASVLTFNGATDICARLHQALISVGNSGAVSAVIDARGIDLVNSNLTCPELANVPVTPWVYGTSTTTTPSTILLPAMPITIQGPWILPNGTRLVGAGVNANLFFAASGQNLTFCAGQHEFND